MSEDRWDNEGGHYQRRRVKMKLTKQIHTYLLPLEETLDYETIGEAIIAHERSLQMAGFSLKEARVDEDYGGIYLTFIKGSDGNA